MDSTAAVKPGDAAQAFLSRAERFLIGGEFVESVSGKTFEVFDPSTGGALARVCEADPRAGVAAVAAAVAALPEFEALRAALAHLLAGLRNQ